MPAWLSADWKAAPLTALDLEGTGAQDGSDEAILEIAAVPVTNGQPDTRAAYSTLINPGRPVPRRPWISPGLTCDVLARAPGPADVGPALGRRIDGRIIVGHNVRVDWRLLHQIYPDVRPAGLVDTLRLARSLGNRGGNSLSALADRLGITPEAERLVPGGQPHRALRDTVATALLLPALISLRWPSGATLGIILEAAGIDMDLGSQPTAAGPAQQALF